MDYFIIRQKTVVKALDVYVHQGAISENDQHLVKTKILFPWITRNKDQIMKNQMAKQNILNLT